MKTICSFLICSICMISICSAQFKPNTAIQGTYKTIYDMLKDVPGLEVRSNSDGRGGSIVVRGISSLRNQQQPLFVIDGAIYGGDISNLNPQDIESITVLKDAASTTAYGTQGLFGVIVISTKKGDGVSSSARVSNHDGSAYDFFIEHKTPMKVFGKEDEVLMQGVIQKIKDSCIVFVNKRKEVLIPISKIKRVEMMQQ